MGEYANYAIKGMLSGRHPVGPAVSSRVYPTTKKAEIAHKLFHVVEVIGGNTNRMRGTMLIVCDQDESSYWVWTSSGVSGIAKDVCRVVQANMALSVALASRGRKPYGGADI